MSSREEMNNTYEQLRAAKAYLAEKLQDAQQRMQAESGEPAATAGDGMQGSEGCSPAIMLSSITDAAPSRPAQTILATADFPAAAVAAAPGAFPDEVSSPPVAAGSQGGAGSSAAGASSSSQTAITEDVDPTEARQEEAVPAAAVSSRLAWSTAELAACRDVLNSAVTEASAFRLSEEAATAAPTSTVASGMSSESAGQTTDLRVELEASCCRATFLEAENQQLRADREAMSERLQALEARTLELESELKVRPFALDSEVQERLAAKDRQLERMRAQADEVTRELELRQETLEAMELRLRQAEKALQLAPAAEGSPVQVPAQTLTMRPIPYEGPSLEDARARVKMLYEQLANREKGLANSTNVVGNGDAGRGRTFSPTAVMLVSGTSSRAPSSGPTAQTATPNTFGGNFDSLQPTYVLQEMSSAANGDLLENSSARELGGPRLHASPTPTNWARRVNPMASSPQHVSRSAPAPSSPQGHPVVAAMSPSAHVEAQRLRQNVAELETLMTQIVGDKARSAQSLERKIVEMDTMVGQANRGSGSMPSRVTASMDGSLRLVGSQSPLIATRAPLEVLRATGSGAFQQAQPPSPTPSSGATRYLYSPQSAARRIPSRSPAPQMAFVTQAVPPSATSAYLSQTQMSATPSRAAAVRASIPVSRSPSPAPNRGGTATLQPAREMPVPMNMWPG